MTEVSFPATVLKSEEKGVAKLWIDTPYDVIVRAFAKENKITPGTKVRAIFQLWENDCSVRAFNLFHALRDRLAEDQDQSREYKDHLKQCLKYDYGVKKEIMTGTYWLKSTTKYTVPEMNRLIDGTITRCLEEGAAIPEFLQEFQDLKKEQHDTRLRKKEDTPVEKAGG